jgi:hypothetical protein
MTSQYGAYALHAGLVRLHALKRIDTPMRPGTHMHARTHIHTQRPVSNKPAYCFSTATMIRERASTLRVRYQVIRLRALVPRCFLPASCLNIFAGSL